MLGRSTGLERPSLDAEAYLRLCGEILKTPPHELASRRKGESLTRRRELIATVGIERWRQGSKALGLVLGMHRDTIGKMATRGRHGALENRGFAERIDDLDHQLATRTNQGPT